MNSWIDLHKDEILSDNSQVENCKICKDCVFRDDGTIWSNNYQKCCCQKYPHPKFKPIEVIDNKGKCVFYKRS